MVIRPIDYTAMRLLRLRATLADFLRRWATYLAIVVVLFGAGSNAPLTVALALASLTMLPLRFAAAHGIALLPMTLAYAVIGTLPVILTRPLWWPGRWAAAEYALPLPGDVIRRSDRLFALLLMAPWQTVLLIGGTGSWFGDDVGRDATDRWWALGGWAVSAAGSLQLSLWWMRAVRRSAVAVRAIPAAAGLRRAGRPTTTSQRLGTMRALLLLPLLRGTARRSALALSAGSSGAIAGAVVPRWTGLSIGWTLAGAALAVLCATSVLRTSTLRELRPLWRDQPHLPLDVRACERGRLVLILLPLIVGGLACLSVAVFDPSPLRPQVCALYGAVVVAGCLLEALTPSTMSPSDHAARWMLMLVAALAFASEISPT